jgi:diazepam-binding inhibitor (GABA receptor modulator, acyl-CoA-binding protein)
MELKESFEKAAIASKSLPSQSNENLLKLYSLYKQSIEGDVVGEKPSNFFDITGIAKFNAWESLKGTSKEDAMQQYVDLVANLAT